jgi:hypothetical protein
MAWDAPLDREDAAIIEYKEPLMKLLHLFFIVASLTGIEAYASDRAKSPQCIGYASVNEVGSIQLNLVSTDPTHGGAMLVLDKSHPLFDEMKKHLGKLSVGRWKCVKSLPTKQGSASL